MKFRWFAGISLAALAATGDAASAQEASADTGNSNDIVVTAQKHEEKLRDVPISISAVTGDTMLRQGATRFSDVAGYIPGMNYEPGGAGAPGEGRFNIRGVASSTSAAATAIYVDDVPTTVHGAFGSAGFKVVDLSPYDIERVEVLRGPQGTLYGDSTIGGLVKYVTRTADVDDFSAMAGAEAIDIKGGEGVGLGARGAVNVPVVPGLFAVRASGSYQETPGFQDNIANGTKGTNEVKQEAWRVAARLTPSADITIDGQWLHSQLTSPDRAMTQLVPGTLTPVYGNYINVSPVAQPNGQKFDLASLTARFDFGGVSLTSASAYSKVVREFTADYTFFVRDFVSDLTGGAITDALGVFSNPNATKKYTQELRLASAPDQPLTWLIGGYYTREDTNSQSLTIPQTAAGETITTLPDIYSATVKARYTDKSLFGNLTYKVTEKWEISGGIRQSWITDRYEQVATGILVGGLATDSSRTKSSATTWSLGSRYIASDDLMIYTRVATGFRAGSTNPMGPGVEPDYGPDSLTSYETGVRADFLNDLASIDVTAYYLDWKDFFILAITPDELFSYTTNGGKATGLGLEFSGTLRPLRRLTLTATAGYTGLKIRRDLPTIDAEKGDRAPNTPAWSGSFQADYTLPLGDWDLSLGGGIRWATHRYSEYPNDPDARRLPGYAVGDLNAAIANDRWTLRAYLRNVTDENKVAAMGLDNRGVLMVPRTFGLSLDVSF